MIGQLAGPLHATLLSSSDGVWLFRLPRGRPGRGDLLPPPTEPAWAVQTSTGRRLLDGPSYTWNMAVDGSRPGYVTFGANWNLLPGTYRTTVTMDASVPTEVETWDSTKNVLLGRTDVPATNGQVAVQSVVRVADRGGDVPFSGWGPFDFLPGGTPGSADRIEIRVWTPGTGPTNVYSLEMQPDPAVRPLHFRSPPPGQAGVIVHPVRSKLPSSTSACIAIRYRPAARFPASTGSVASDDPVITGPTTSRDGSKSLLLYVIRAPTIGAAAENGTVGAIAAHHDGWSCSAALTAAK